MSSNSKRDLYLKIRVSREELDAIDRKFKNSGMSSRSDFVRAMILIVSRSCLYSKNARQRMAGVFIFKNGGFIMKMTVGRFLEQNVEDGTIAENQIIVLYDKNNNISWIGKAGYAPIYFDWIELQNYRYVGHELQINRRINTAEMEAA